MQIAQITRIAQVTLISEKMKKAFTITELMVAVAVLAITMAGVSTIFKISITAYRTSSATAEVMRNLRAITDQLDADFKSLRKDGYLLMRSTKTPPVWVWQREAESANRLDFLRNDVHRDNMFYFSTGDFQTITQPYLRSNIALVYVGPYSRALDPNDIPPYASEWILLRSAMLLCPEEDEDGLEYLDISFAEIKTWTGPPSLYDFVDMAMNTLPFGYPIDVDNPAQNWQYFSGGVGNIEIEWNDGTKAGNSLVWFGLEQPRRVWDAPDTTYADAITENVNVIDEVYTAQWTPANQPYWPMALKFTFTLYDSKGVLEKGMTFTHIVYIEN